jgi:hypothetical protein
MAPRRALVAAYTIIAALASIAIAPSQGMRVEPHSPLAADQMQSATGRRNAAGGRWAMTGAQTHLPAGLYDDAYDDITSTPPKTSKTSSLKRHLAFPGSL